MYVLVLVLVPFVEGEATLTLAMLLIVKLKHNIGCGGIFNRVQYKLNKTIKQRLISNKTTTAAMAGTRLLIQSIVLVTLSLVIFGSVRYGFCRSTCARGNLGKEFPRVPGGNGVGVEAEAVVESQWWEEPICHPIRSAFEAYRLSQQQQELSDDDARVVHNADGVHNEFSSSSSSPRPVRRSLTLAVENATNLPDWIDVISRDLFVGDEDNNGDDDSTSMLSVLLKRNKMGLEILPHSSSSALVDDDPKQLAAKLWSINQKIIESAAVATATPDRQNLVLYIPSYLLPPTATEREDDRYIEWKSFRTTTKAKPKETENPATATTVLIPSLRSSSESATIAATTTTTANSAKKSSNLKSLVEDWMARSMIIEKQQQLAQGQHHPGQQYQKSSESPRKRRRRLTPEYPVDRFLAIIMPLIFPLVAPFTITWIKEAKRYKRLKRKQ